MLETRFSIFKRFNDKGGIEVRCLYREKKYYCGDYLEVEVYPVFAKQRGRVKKYRESTETQKRLNKRNAERRLVRLIHTNFSDTDIRFDLTYEPAKNPDTFDEALRHLQNFLRRLKRCRIKHGLPELKYIASTERGSRKGRFHHHLIIQGDMNLNELAKIWGKGYTSALPLQFTDTGVSGLGVYMAKEDGKTKRWSSSKNLKQPKVVESTGRLSHKKVNEIYQFGIDGRNEVEKNFKGYCAKEIKAQVNDVNGYIYAFLFLKKLKPDKRRRL